MSSFCPLHLMFVSLPLSPLSYAQPLLGCAGPSLSPTGTECASLIFRVCVAYLDGPSLDRFGVRWLDTALDVWMATAIQRSKKSKAVSSYRTPKKDLGREAAL